MMDFREWVLLGEVREEVQGSILRDLALSEAFKDLLEFYNSAVATGLGVFRESDEDDEDDGPAEIADPFTGDEDAKPASVADDEEDETSADEEDRRERRVSQDQEPDSVVAKRIQELAWKVRWGAMLDRKEAIDRIRKIYDEEWMPLMARRQEQIRGEYEKAAKSYSDEDARREVGKKFGMSTYEVGRLLASAQNEWSVIKEEEGDDDDFKLPRFDDEEEEPNEEATFDDGIRRIRTSVEPLLIKLGYIEEGDLSRGRDREYDRQRLLGRAMKGAYDEVGNEPPKNEATEELKSDPGKRAEAKRRLQEELHNRFRRTAEASYFANSKTMGRSDKVAGSSGGRRGSVYFQGYEDILNQGVMSVMNSLTRRNPTKDMTAPEWDEDIKVLAADVENEPGAVLGSIGARMSHLSATRDEARARNKASGQASGSTAGPTFLGSGAMQDDGTQGNIDPSDRTDQGSLANAETSETRGQILTAFRRAMAELKDKDPLHAMLICMKLDLRCGQNGDYISGDIFGSNFSPHGSGIQTPESFFSRIGLADLARGEADHELTRRISPHWDRLKDLKGKAGRRAAPTMSDGSPMKERPAGNPALAKEWDKFRATVRDAAGEAFKWIAKRVFEIMGDMNREYARPAGQRDPSSWDMARFLRAQFPPPTARVTESKPTAPSGSRLGMRAAAAGEHSIKLEFRERKKVRQSDGSTEEFYAPIKVWDILVQDDNISIFQSFPEGFEDNDFEFKMPEMEDCTCGGSDETCDKCGGRGLFMDSSKLRDLEYRLRNLLIRDQRRVGKG